MGSGGKLRAPCPIAVLAADDLQPRVAIAFFGDPEFSSRDRLGQVEQLRATSEIQQDRSCPTTWCSSWWPDGFRRAELISPSARQAD